MEFSCFYDYGINTNKIVSPSVLKIFERVLFLTVWKQFLQIVLTQNMLSLKILLQTVLNTKIYQILEGGSVWGKVG